MIKDEQGQIILLAGFILAVGIISFSIVLHTAAFAGHRTIEQETCGVNHDFKSLKSTYGTILRDVSNFGATDPFAAPQLTTHENQLIELYALEGYAVTFVHVSYDDIARTATVQIIFSDGETTYTETVTYELG
ncbi:MAG: hypothetical protein LRZ87_03700 [Methanocellales archaeon]|nr:hypothetical protein [Methanocellales archaeon]